MEILLIFVIIFCVLPYLLRPLLLFIVKRKMRSTMDQMYEQHQRQYGSSQSASSPGNNPAPRKKIDKDVGEYVKFEEITDPNTSASGSDNIDNSSHRSHKAEPQISDVDWEEIK